MSPLALIAKQAGYRVSGSDKQDSDYIKHLRAKGINNLHIGQTKQAITALHTRDPIDWVVYTSAIPKENPNHPELVFAEENGIPHTKRDEFLNELLSETGQKMIAIAGTHGKTTTTAMAIWLFKQLNIPVSYSVGGKLSFGETGEFDPEAQYFVYEADEYDRNFLSFTPELSLISGIDWDHADIYPTREDYYAAFEQFLGQSAHTALWEEDAHKLKVSASDSTVIMADDNDTSIITLQGEVNRKDAYLVASALELLSVSDWWTRVKILNGFPGVSRRFEKLADNIYTDYAHTPEKIAGALQLTHEIAGPNVVVVYEGLHNTRQHFIKEELKTLFNGVKKLYVVPSYLAREDESLELLTPKKLSDGVIQAPIEREPAELNDDLLQKITAHADNGDLVLCISAGGGGSLDEWLRNNISK